MLGLFSHQFSLEIPAGTTFQPTQGMATWAVQNGGAASAQAQLSVTLMGPSGLQQTANGDLVSVGPGQSVTLSVSWGPGTGNSLALTDGPGVYRLFVDILDWTANRVVAHHEATVNVKEHAAAALAPLGDPTITISLA